MADKTFHCSVVTPEKEVVDTAATFVAFPAHDGEIGILAHRAPLLVQLGKGKLRIEKAGGETLRFQIEGGFAQMVDNKLTILTENAQPA